MIFPHQVGDLTFLLAVDCESLYDTVVSANPSLQDKRSLVNVKSIQEYVNQRRMRWIPTHIMMADGLTKQSKNSGSREWLLRPIIQIREWLHTSSTSDGLSQLWECEFWFCTRIRPLHPTSPRHLGARARIMLLAQIGSALPNPQPHGGLCDQQVFLLSVHELQTLRSKVAPCFNPHSYVGPPQTPPQAKRTASKEAFLFA